MLHIGADGCPVQNCILYRYLLVTYDGIVYDVTQFANDHPGGRELLLTAAGQDLKHFFENYKVHTQTDKAAAYLAGMVIGRLTDADAIKARALAPLSPRPLEDHLLRR